MARARGFSLLSGGLDSQLAVCVLREAGAEVEGITFETPFFSADAAKKAADALKLPLTVVDFTADELALVKHPPHGFGGAMNPCIDCHMTMIRRAGELMRERGWDFVATGEVLNQRPMSQNKQSLGVVARGCGLEGRLVRPLSAQLLEPTVPELEGVLDRSKLLGLSGRQRQAQFELAAKFGVTDFPSPAGGCRLTEKGFGRRLKDLLDHEGLEDRRLVELLNVARRFRLPGGASVILGRDASDNALLAGKRAPGEVLVAPVSVPGPTALILSPNASDLEQVRSLICSYSRFDAFPGEITVKEISDAGRTDYVVPRPYVREVFKPYQLV